MFRMLIATLLFVSFIPVALSEESPVKADGEVQLVTLVPVKPLPAPQMSVWPVVPVAVQCGNLKCDYGCCGNKIGNQCSYSCSSQYAPFCPNYGNPC
jgi:hypothetical protein